MTVDQNLLNGTQAREWSLQKSPVGVIPKWIYTGRDESGLGPIYVGIATVSAPPTRESLRALHIAYKGKQNFQLVVGAISGDQIWIFGPDERTEITGPLEIEQGCRQLQSALDEPDAIAAYTRLGQFRRSLDTTSLLGVTNSGLFASYHIRENVPKRNDWNSACERSKQLLTFRNEELIKALGFKSEKTAGNALLLTASTPHSKAVAILLDETEQFDATSARHTGISPVAFGLNVAARQGVPWLFVLRKDQIRIYPAKDGVGVGQKGQVDTYLEIDLSAIDSERAGLLTLIFSAEALEVNGSTNELLEGSQLFASKLGTRLRERIYEHVVPQLSKSVAEYLQEKGTNLDSEGLSLAYKLSLRILFRLLFQAYAEDRGLLPAGRNEGFDANSLKTIAKRIINTPIEQFGKSKTLWFDLVQVWDAIDEGNETWSVPAYNGGLFGKDPEIHSEGALIEKLDIQDDILGPVLQHLLLDMSEDDVLGPVDFRSLSVREFGTIYEGLLESSLSVATQDLTVDSKGAWVPANKDDQVLATAGSIYFHSASGERKATGSYFTPSIIVDHLIDRSLNPALDAHLESIKQYLINGDQATAARKFFDFRVVDLAMGSGHFLVAAIDRIEAKMRTFLSEKETQIPGINAELIRLANAAKLALGKDESAIGEIEPAALLRRQIARRCIYGLDINQLAVELSRLAIWIHTFVPGLPMSSLDHGLVCANSLTGIGTIDEVIKALSPDDKTGQISFYERVITENLEKSSELLIEVANSDEAKKSEVKEAALIAQKIRREAEPTLEVFNAAVAARLAIFDPRSITDEESLSKVSQSVAVKEVITRLNPAHLPYLFPEVFLRNNPGFDVLLGNPPWEELVYEEIKFWTLRNPGLRGKKIAEQVSIVETLRKENPDQYKEMQIEMDATNKYRKILMSGPYLGMGSGHADLYKAFSWRYLQLCRNGGFIGAVLPRGALTAAGSTDWRLAIMKQGHFVETTFLANTNGWVFPSVHSQYSFALVIAQKHTKGKTLLAGPFGSNELFNQFTNSTIEPLLDGTSIVDWSETAAFPLLPSEASVELFLKIRKSPSLGSIKVDNFEFSPVQGDFNQTTDRNLIFLGDKDKGDLLAYKGASFNLWCPETGEILGSADSKNISKFIAKRLERSSKMVSSAFYKQKSDSSEKYAYVYENPRIAFRLITNQTNTRTIISCLIPPGVVLGNGAPFLVRRAGNERSEAYLLGILSSIPLDWYARRFVELNVNFHILNGFPIPILKESPIHDRLINLAGELAAVDKRFSKWANKVGVSVGLRNNEIEKEDAINEIDALTAILYGLSRDNLVQIFETFHIGWDFTTRLKRTLLHFDSWSLNNNVK